MKIKIILVYILVLTLMITGCASDKPIRIGFVGTLTGPTSDTAIAGRRGVEMAVDEINSSGGVNGRSIELVVKDSLNDKEISKKVAEEFLEENIQLVIGDFTSNLTKSALEVIDGKDILYLSPTASSDYFNDKDDNLLRISGKSDNIVGAILQQMKAEGDDNIVIFKDKTNLVYVDTFSEAIESKVENNGGLIIDQVYFNGDQAIEGTSIISKLNDLDGEYDGILLLANASSTVSIVQTIRAGGINSNIYTSGWSNTPDLIRLGGQYIEGIYTVGAVDAASTKVEYIEFADKYEDYYGAKPSLPSMFAYDTMIALNKGLHESKSVKAKAVKKAIIDIGIVEGLQDTFEIDKFGDSSREYMQFIIKDGEIVRSDLSDNE